MSLDIMKGVIRIHDELVGEVIPAGVPVRVHKIRFLGTNSGLVSGLADAGGAFPGKWSTTNLSGGSVPRNFEFNPPLVFDGLQTLTTSPADFFTGRCYLYTS